MCLHVLNSNYALSLTMKYIFTINRYHCTALHFTVLENATNMALGVLCKE